MIGRGVRRNGHIRGHFSGQLTRCRPVDLVGGDWPETNLELRSGVRRVDVELAVLGELRMLVDGLDVTPTSTKERALAAILAIRAGQTVGVDRLIEELWPDLDAECPVLEAESARLEEVRLVALEDRIAAELAIGAHRRLVPEIEALVTAHPLRERLWELLVVALYRCGRQAEALRACTELRRQLRDELGLQPSPALRNLETAVLNQSPTLDWHASESSPDVVPDPFAADPAEAMRVAVDERQEVRFTRTPDGVHLAYQVVGDGPQDLIIVPGYLSHLDTWWEAWSGRLIRRLSSFSRLILFDARGLGLSDRPLHLDVDDWAQDAVAVLDAVGTERASILGMSAGGAIAALVAATHPDRVSALVMYGSYPRWLADPDDPLFPGPGSTEILEERIASVEQGWGSGAALGLWCPNAAGDPELVKQFGLFERSSCSPDASANYLRAVGKLDVRDVLPVISVPTMVLHPSRDGIVPIELARWTAARIPGAVLVELVTDDHLLWYTNALDALTDAVEEFLTSAVSQAEPRLVLSTIAAIDAEGHDVDDLAAARDLVASHRGAVVESGGSVMLASFDGPSRAIHCSAAIAFQVGRGGRRPRIGVHTGECEPIGGTVRGSAVDVAQQVMGQAQPGEVLASQAVVGLVTGSAFEFARRGLHRFLQTAGRMRLFAVTSS